jgi:copper transport protein
VPDATVLLEAGAKAVLYASLLLLIGANALRWLLVPRCALELGPRFRLLFDSSARIALRTAIVALCACLFRAWTHTVAAFGFDEAGWDNLKLIALQSRWGHGWQLQVAAVLMLVIACVLTVRWQAAWPFETLAVLFFTATIPLLGHAAGDLLRITLHTIHILAAGTWLGTLAMVLLVRMPDGDPDSIGAAYDGQRVRQIILRRFWLVAVPSAAVAVAAGVLAAYLYIGSFSNLWTTAYGRMLLVKVALVGGISACGYSNWQRLRKLHPEKLSEETVIVLEAALAGAVVLVTALLTETGHPG